MFSKLKRMLLGTDEPQKETFASQSPFLTNTELVEQTVAHFRQRMAEESTPSTLLYPTNFIIYLNSDDYDQRQQAFPFVVKDLAATFNQVIEAQHTRYPAHVSHALYWQFQFIPFQADSIVDIHQQRLTQLQHKELFIVSTLTAVDESQSGSSAQVKTTLHLKDSMQAVNLAINWSALPGVDVRSKDLFRVNCKTGQTVSTANSSAQSTLVNSNYFPPLRAVGGGTGSRSVSSFRLHSTTPFLFQGGLSADHPLPPGNFFISGRNDSEQREGIPVVRLNSEYVTIPHVLIRHNAQTDTFELQPRADLVLNEQFLTASDRWYPLPPGSEILLGDDIQVTFHLPLPI